MGLSNTTCIEWLPYSRDRILRRTSATMLTAGAAKDAL